MIGLFRDSPDRLILAAPAHALFGWDLVWLVSAGAFLAFGVLGLMQEVLPFFAGSISCSIGVIGSLLFLAIWVAQVGLSRVAQFDRAEGVLRVESTFFGSLADVEQVSLEDVRSVEVQSGGRGGMRFALITEIQ